MSTGHTRQTLLNSGRAHTAFLSDGVVRGYRDVWRAYLQNPVSHRRAAPLGGIAAAHHFPLLYNAASAPLGNLSRAVLANHPLVNTTPRTTWREQRVRSLLAWAPEGSRLRLSEPRDQQSFGTYRFSSDLSVYLSFLQELEEARSLPLTNCSPGRFTADQFSVYGPQHFAPTPIRK